MSEIISEEEQWDINNKILLESYQEDEVIEEVYAEENIYNNAKEYNDFINSLDSKNTRNLENGVEAIVDVRSGNKVECWIRGKGDYNIKYAFCAYYPN